MRFKKLKQRLYITGLFLVLVTAALTLPVRALDWLPVNDEDRAATSSTIDPDAGAEILYRMEQFDSSALHTAYTEEYVRIKIFDEKGVRRTSRIDVDCNDYEHIDTLAARVIKPDGTIINVDKKSFFERDVVKFGDVRVKVRSFSFPTLAPGDIVEYQARKIRDRFIIGAMLRFQKDLPTRHVLFRIKPVPNPPRFRTVGFAYRCAQQEATLSRDGYNCVEMRNLPAYETEPYGPPPADIQAWMIFYPTEYPGKPDAYWKKVGTEAASVVERHARKPSKVVRGATLAVVANATDTLEKLARINDYCREKIVNAVYFPPKGDMDRKQILSERRAPDDLINTGYGNSRDIPMLFIAMARSEGIDARLVLAADWMHGGFKKPLQHAFYLNAHLVAAKVGDDWRFYDPARCQVSTGTLHWQNEGAAALIATPKDIEWIALPVTSSAQSVQKRTARLKLDEEGTLTGRITIEYDGQSENLARLEYYKRPIQRIVSRVRNRERVRMPSCEVSPRMSVVNKDDLQKPMKLTYQIKIPNYAEKAGNRLFFQPSYFEKGRRPMFSKETRTEYVFFRTPVAVEDDVMIQLPAGHRLEEASAPHSLGDRDWGSHKISVSVKKSANTLIYKRTFIFNHRMIPANQYKQLKTVFDYVQAKDSHMLTLNGGAPLETE